MHPGDLLAERFLLEELAGFGGMGEVYKALDRQTGQPVAVKLLSGKRGDMGGETITATITSDVAVKLLSGKRGDHAARFVREARILADLHHPYIVRHVAHGALPSGEPYLVMQWLDGEDLSARLARGRLDPGESVQLAARIAEVLGFAHARGIIHRDLKPGNVFLVGGRLDAAVLLDFGIAYLTAETRMTRTGTMVGTPGYMAPEQARSSEQIDARADVFSLGCVLFECLTGQPAFSGAHVMALLAKVLFDEPPSVREKIPALPDALGALVTRMLAKNPEDRPPDGGAVAQELRALGEMPALSMPPLREDAEQRESLTDNEKRAVAVILIGPPERRDSEEIRAGTEEIDAGDALGREAARFGGQFERLADGSVAVMLAGATLATDLAAEAARCALSLHQCTSGRSVALAMARSDLTGRRRAGHAIDSATRLFMEKPLERSGPLSVPILLDDVAARLLDARFDVREGEAGFVLHGERALGEGTRTLLGKATPCVGRERELLTLDALFSECVEEGVAQAVLVTAPPGVGKSRLGQEFLRHVGDRRQPVAIWLGRGDSLRAGAAFTLLGQAIRGACGIRDGEPLDACREKLATRVAERVTDGHRRRVTEFLGEIIGTPFPDDDSLPLRAARTDAQLMNDQMRAAFFDFLSAECEANPLLIVLEDLHWGDRPTVQFLDRALRDLRHKPLFVLAMARPEVRELFPKLWAGANTQEVRLYKLSPKAIERLSRHVLGESVQRATIERLVELSEGNAFYLEELIRATAEGRGAELPETVVAMVQSRLGALDAGSRRLLQAASIFGEVFWGGGVVRLLGAGGPGPGVSVLLGTLVDQELVMKHKDSRFPGEDEYAFRHALLREGAYAMLTDDNRVLGHRLAGEWLERKGEQDPLVLAEHFTSGGESERAGHHFLHASERAIWGFDAAATVAHVQRALSEPVSDELRLALLGTLCEGQMWQPELSGVVLPHAEELVRVTAPGSRHWTQGMLGKLLCAMQSSRFDDVRAILQSLQKVVPCADAVGTLAVALTAGLYMLDMLGDLQNSDAVMERLAVLAGAMKGGEPRAEVLWHVPTAARKAVLKEQPWSALQHAQAGVAMCSAMGHYKLLGIAQVFVGMAQRLLGSADEAEATLKAIALPDDEVGYSSPLRRVNLALLLADRSAFDESRAWADHLIASGRARHAALDEGRGHWVLAEVLRRMGDLDAADAEIQACLDLLGSAPPLDYPVVLATLAALRLAQKRPSEALAAAEEGLVQCESMGASAYGRGAFLRLTHAECLEATGNHDAARTAIAKARERLLANADKIGDPAYRKSFLENVPENRKTLDLARQWLEESA
jgi:serine/threonine protein kinase/tetratricopeptide (TPR) repeat protein